MKSILIACLLFFGTGLLHAQQTMDIPITKDAFIEYEPNDPNRANMNFGMSSLLAAHAWTNSMQEYVRRTVFDVDLSGLPAGIIIDTAKIFLFSRGDHWRYTTSNECYLNEMSGTWSELGLTWNNQTSLAPTGDSIYVPPSDSSGTDIKDLDYVLDVSDIVSENYGEGTFVTTFRLKLITEVKYARLNFCSSEHSDTTRHPFIRVTYTSLSPYVEFQSKLDGNYYECVRGKLRIKTHENYYVSNGDLNIKFYDSSNNLVYFPSGISNETGFNLHEIDLKATAQFTDGAFYVAKIWNAKGRPKLLRFQYND